MIDIKPSPDYLNRTSGGSFSNFSMLFAGKLCLPSKEFFIIRVRTLPSFSITLNSNSILFFFAFSFQIHHHIRAHGEHIQHRKVKVIFISL